jgi:hypothetical protein
VLHAQPESFQVDVEDAVPGVLRQVGQWLGLALDPRVVDGDVHAAVRVDRCLYHRLDVVGVAHVRLDEGGRPARRLDPFDGLCAAPGVDVGDDDVRAARSELFGSRSADARRRAGDDRCPVFEIVRHGSKCHRSIN